MYKFSIALASALLSSTAFAADVNLFPGNNIQAAVNANPPGTRFLLNSDGNNFFREQTISPKDNQIFQGVGGNATLMGSRRITTWQQEGTRWFAPEQNQQALLQNEDECDAQHPRCAHPNTLFRDGQPLRHAGTKASMATGTFWMDYPNDRIYIADNPAGHFFEAAVTQFAFRGPASRVQIRNLRIMYYATPLGDGAITSIDGAQAWTLLDVDARLNHSVGVDFGTNWSVTRSRFVSNGMAGYAGGGQGFAFKSNEVANNGWAGVNDYWEGGGGKVTETGPNASQIRYNCVHDNKGPGIWADINADALLISNNKIWGNSQAGIFYEISGRITGAKIQQNTVFDNGQQDTITRGWFWPAQILISTSNNTTVSNNVVDTPIAWGNGIVIISQARPWGGGHAQGNIIRNNNIRLRGTEWGRMGAVTDDDSAQAFVAGNNQIYSNNYKVANQGQQYWNWSDADRTFAQMKAIGREVNSTITTTMVAVPTKTCEGVYQ